MGKRNLEWVDGKKIIVHVKNMETGKTATLQATDAFLALLRQPPADAKGASEREKREHSRNSRHSDELSRKIAAMPEKDIVAISHPQESKRR